MEFSGVFILGIIFIIVAIVQIILRRKLILKSEFTYISWFAMIVTLFTIFLIAFKQGKTIYDYIVIPTGIIMMFIILTSAGLTNEGFKSFARLRSPTQKWEGVDSVEIKSDGKYTKVTYSGDRESNVLYFKEEDFNTVLEKLGDNLTGKVKIKVIRDDKNGENPY